MEAVRYENQPLGTMDFNKIIPMPNNIFRGSLGQRELQLYGKNNWYDLASRRLQKVVIENKDFEKLLAHYDRESSFFYCDPPYFATESYYKDVGFTANDHIRLRDALLKCKGKFLVSYNDCPEIREIWSQQRIIVFIQFYLDCFFSIFITLLHYIIFIPNLQ